MHKTALFIFSSILLGVGLQRGLGVSMYLEGNPSCVSLGYTYGMKVDPPITGTYALGNGTVTRTTNAVGEINRTSTFGVDAVIVKGGPNANLFAYNPEALAGMGLTTPRNPNNGSRYGLSHVEFCYDYEVNVTKTTNPLYTREYLWLLNKVANTTGLNLFVGQTGTIDYTVTALSSGYLDKDRGVTGMISIYNPDPENVATIQDIQEQMSGAILQCPVSLPYLLAPQATLDCTYSAVLPDASATTNTVSAQTTGKVGGNSVTVPIVFGEPTMLLDQSAVIFDDKVGFLGTGNLGSPLVVSYPFVVGPYAATGSYNVDNTATLTTSNTQKILQSLVSIPIVVAQVPTPPQEATGCTYTQGYWKTHNIYGKGNNLIPRTGGGGATIYLENAIFYLSNQTWYEVISQTPKGGNVYYILAHQYIAAVLNGLAGAKLTPEVQAALVWANTFFTTKTPTTLLNKTEKTQATTQATLLDSYNNGLIGPGHCE